MSSYNNFKSTTIRGAFNNLNYPDNTIKASAYFQNDVSISGQLYVNNINCVNLNSYNVSSLINSLSGPIYNNFINQYLINNSLSGLIFNNFTNQYLINNSLSGLILNNFRNQNLINNSLSGLIFNNFTNQYLINNSLSGLIFNNFTNQYLINNSLSGLIYNNYLTTSTVLNNYSQLSNINTFTNNQLIYKNIYLNDAGFNNMNYMQLSLVASGSASATNPSVCGIDFTTFNGKGNSSARIYGLDNNAYSAHLVFCTAPPNGFYNSQERMRIQDNGNIAIGKTTASYLLDVNGSINGTTIYENGTSISSKYLTIANASSTYATITSLSNYLTTSSASSTYLSIANASSTYATITSLSNYLTTSSASSTYATITSLSNYLTTSSASSTYATITSLSNFLLATSPAVSSYSIAITEDITPTSAYIPFTLSSTSVSNAILKISSYLNYNPSTNTLNCNHRGSVTVQSGANLQLQPGATSNICPIGTILMMAVQSSFSGWLSCNGATCSTTTYAGLFNVIGYAYGGSGATFNVPDFQGAFLRGFGSPNTSRNLSYASDAFGTYQASQIGSHTHSLNLSNNGVSSGVASAYVGTGINAQTTTTTETRPYNYAVQYYIKY